MESKITQNQADKVKSALDETTNRVSSKVKISAEDEIKKTLNCSLGNLTMIQETNKKNRK